MSDPDFATPTISRSGAADRQGGRGDSGRGGGAWPCAARGSALGTFVTNYEDDWDSPWGMVVAGLDGIFLFCAKIIMPLCRGNMLQTKMNTGLLNTDLL